ncbi:ATPase [Solibacillus sp. FSL K6-1523]|uniref:ATPase n=1 Tax=Solibacillus sp. FSL K6-1523 TaxID=2921471 RepID=UPI0030F918A7
MYKDVRKEDCLFLNSEQQFNQFLELADELELFTLILPIKKYYLHKAQLLYDIWCILSKPKEKRIENPENVMIFCIRNSFMKMIENYPMKRYIQKAALENGRLAYVCAIYILKAVNDYFTVKITSNESLASNFEMIESYKSRGIRAYYNEQYQGAGKYPKDLARLQRKITTEINEIYQINMQSFHWYMNEIVDEAERVYEAVFGLVNDWGGRVP